MKTLPGILICLVVTTTAAATAQEPPPDVPVTAMPEFAVARPGSSLRVAVRISIPDGWRIGWTNPGLRGTPTTLSWHAARKIRAGRPVWPLPTLDTTGATPANFYRGDIVVLTRFEIPASATLGAVELRGTLAWGLCRESCIEQHQAITASLTIDTVATEASAGWADWETAGVSFQPVPLRLRFVHAAFDRDSLRLTILLPGGPPPGSRMTFFPAESPRAALVVPVHSGRSAWWARLPLEARDGTGRIAGVIVVPLGQQGSVGFALDAHVSGRRR